MYARSSTFHGRPASIDAGIRMVETEVGPALAGMDGCLGLSMMVDRDTGACITTSSWQDEATMMGSDAMLRAVRERCRDVLGASMEVDSWEIMVMHRTHHGECCRSSWMMGDLDTMTDGFRVGVLPQLEGMDGFCSASMLADRSAGLCCITSAWESRAAMEASRMAADDLRTRLAGEASGEVAEVHEFDLAYAHLHVPEMA